MNYKAPFPHCDSNVLHAPSECEYCDHYPEEQENRIKNNINFTGHGNDPATDVRPLTTIYRWAGNVPKSKSLREYLGRRNNE